MPTFRQSALMSALLLGAACAQPIDVTSQAVDVTFTSVANQPALTRYDATYVRSYMVNEQDVKTETTGVNYTLNGSGFNAAVQTPAIVNLPIFGTSSRAITVSCNDGQDTKVVQVMPYNVTSAERINSGANGGLLGVVVMASVDAVRDKTADTWGYRDITIKFEE